MPFGTQQSSIVSAPLPSGQSGLLHGQWDRGRLLTLARGGVGLVL